MITEMTMMRDGNNIHLKVTEAGGITKMTTMRDVIIFTLGYGGWR